MPSAGPGPRMGMLPPRGSVSEGSSSGGITGSGGGGGAAVPPPRKDDEGGGDEEDDGDDENKPAGAMTHLVRDRPIRKGRRPPARRPMMKATTGSEPAA